jgi:hypothetical protein
LTLPRATIDAGASGPSSASRPSATGNHRAHSRVNRALPARPDRHAANNGIERTAQALDS